jgi:predicted lipoprotein
VGTQGSLKRRELVTGLLALSQLPACRKRDRNEVLEGLVSAALAALVDRLVTESKQLRGAVQGLLEAPQPERLAGARQAFKTSTLAWKRAAAFRAGPFASTQAFQRAAFWPARPSSIEAVLAAPEAIDEPRIEGLGVDAKGLFALEYLLFSGAQGARLDGPEPTAIRVREYCFELSCNILGYASRVRRVLGDGRAYARGFGAMGQQGVDELVAQSVDTLDIVLGKFARVERAQQIGAPFESAVEGYFSKLSLDIVIALLEGTRLVYVGASRGSLSELVAQSSPAIDDHVREAFALADSSLAALGQPLEVGLTSAPDRFRRAVGAVEQLKHVMKAEMVSALEA